MARWNRQTHDGSIAFLRVYNQIKSAAHKVTCPARSIPQQQQLRPFLSTHTHTPSFSDSQIWSGIVIYFFLFLSDFFTMCTIKSIQIDAIYKWYILDIVRFLMAIDVRRNTSLQKFNLYIFIICIWNYVLQTLSLSNIFCNLYSFNKE